MQPGHALGHVYQDADYGGGRHPHAKNSYGGCGFVQKHTFNSPDDPPGTGPDWYSIMLPVPASMHQRMLETRPRTRLTLALVPWSQTSGFGLLVLCALGAAGAAGDAVVAVLDIAGRADLEELQAAERRGRLAVGVASDADPAVTPLVPVTGFSEAMSDARLLRRLAARELVASVEEVSSILRGPAAHALLGGLHPLAAQREVDSRLDSLTVAVCPLA